MNSKRAQTALLISIITLVGSIASSVVAQSQKEVCQTLADPISSAATTMDSMSSSLSGLDVSSVIKFLEGDVKASYLEMARLQAELLPVLNAYIDQLDETALITRRCAR